MFFDIVRSLEGSSYYYWSYLKSNGNLLKNVFFSITPGAGCSSFNTYCWWLKSCTNSWFFLVVEVPRLRTNSRTQRRGKGFTCLHSSDVMFSDCIPLFTGVSDKNLETMGSPLSWVSTIPTKNLPFFNMF